jgi:integrase
LSHHTKKAYINTGLFVLKKNVNVLYDKNGHEVQVITNRHVLDKCNILIDKYYDRLQQTNMETMTVQQIVDFLKEEEEEVSFSDYINNIIAEKYREKKDNTATSYASTHNSLKRYLRKDKVFFSDLKRPVIDGWIKSLNRYKRSRNMYPALAKAVITSAMKEYNDYEANIIRIKYNPFYNIEIPEYRSQRDRKEKEKETDAGIIKRIITLTGQKEGSRAELAVDVACLILHLCGINCADLYDLKTSALSTKVWRLSYNRKKTRDRSDSGSLMKITVPEEIRPLFEKYKGKGEYLFNFASRYCESNDFTKYVNKGLEVVCKQLEIKKVSTYNFRHAWATIAQNNCGASTEQVAFCLCHESAHKVTKGYIKQDFSLVDRINREVINYIMEKDI